MSWFENKRRKMLYPTKMFVNYLPEVSQAHGNENIQTKSVGGSILTTALGVQGVAVEMLLLAAPKLLDQGMVFVANTLESFANDKAYSSRVQRNFDIINPAKFSLPSKITLVRGNFAEHKEVQGEVFGDGEKQHYNQAILLDNKELHIEIEIIQSKDKSAFYFQPTSYFYKGESPEGDKVEEVVLAFAFLSAGESTLSPQKKFQSFVHFNALTPSRFYNFKSKSGYDTSFQSPWISTPLEEVVPYTLLIEIQEIREGNAFAKLLQTIYLENKNNFKSKFNEKLNSHNSNESKQSNEDNV